MKKVILLAAASAAFLGMANIGQAADMPLKAPVMPPPPPPPFSWTGFYIGGNMGATWSERHWTEAFTGLGFSRSTDALAMGGGQIGFNYQFNTSWVLGVEWDFDTVAHNNRVGIFGPFAVQGASDKWLSTLAARLGYAGDHWLLYVKGGVGEVSARGITVTDLNTGLTLTGGGRTISGGMFGVGLEYAVTNNFTVKAEYDYIALSDNRGLVLPVGRLAGDVFTNHSTNVQAFKVGLNYLFNFGRGGYNY